MRETLITSMKNMFQDNNQEGESDKYLFFSPKYNPQVKVSDWFLILEAEPKDNNPYNPPGGNYFLSTYNHLGHELSSTQWETTTQAMLQQICTRETPIHIHKPLVSPGSQLLLRQDQSRKSKEVLRHNVHFLTTYDTDFQEPFPFRIRTIQTEKKAQKRFGLKPNFTSPKIRETKFLDDDDIN